MLWKMILTGLAIFVFVLLGPFMFSGNSAAQALYGTLITAVSTTIGIFASWHFSKNADKDTKNAEKERLTRYGLLAWRNVDALSVKVRQQIQRSSAGRETLESWLLDIDGAKLDGRTCFAKCLSCKGG